LAIIYHTYPKPSLKKTENASKFSLKSAKNPKPK
jgi:hypothetical protein